MSKFEPFAAATSAAKRALHGLAQTDGFWSFATIDFNSESTLLD